MKITKDYLKKVIKEEYNRLLIEQSTAEQLINKYQSIVDEIKARLESSSLKTFRADDS